MTNKNELEIETYIYFKVSGKCQCGKQLDIIGKDINNEQYTFECPECYTKCTMCITQE